MELQQLKYFQVIACTQNISAAAKQLYIAQPSLSQTLKRLENEIGMPLFDRIGKQIVLNHAGEIFLKHVNAVFQSLENAQRELQTYKEDKLTTVGICIQCASLLIPEIIGEVQSAYPDIQLQLFQHPDMDNIDMDLKISSDHTFTPEPDSIMLMKEPLGIVLPKNHRLSDKEIITFSDLSAEHFISLSIGHDLYNIISFYCKKYNFSPNISTYVDSPNVMRDLLRINLGIAFIPQYTWESFYHDSLVFKPVVDLPMYRCIILSWDESKYMTPSVRRCRDMIIEYFKSYNQRYQSDSAF